MKKPKDVLRVVSSDWHAGSVCALTVNRPWQGQKTAVIYPTSLQQKIYDQFKRYMDSVAEARTGKTVELVLNGDLIDGNHHSSGDVFTTDTLEMAEVCIELIEEFKRGIDWQAGDKLWVTRGTDVHTGNIENHIARQVNAEPCGDFYVYDFLELETYGTLSWFVHHGPGAGKGGNEGNTVRNWLRNAYLRLLKDGKRVPDVIYSGHMHQAYWAPLEIRTGDSFRMMHGILTPSWQSKTRYAWQKVPLEENRIGGMYHTFTSSGDILPAKFVLMST